MPRWYVLAGEYRSGYCFSDVPLDPYARGDERPASAPRLEYQGRRFREDHPGHSVLWAEIWPLVSHEVRRALSESQLTGWSTYDVDLVHKGQVYKGAYFGLSFHGRVDALQIDQSRTVTDLFGGVVAIPHWVGIPVNDESWTGGDFVMGADRRRNWQIVTERVVAFFKAHRFRGCRFIDVSEVAMPAF